MVRNWSQLAHVPSKHHHSLMWNKKIKWLTPCIRKSLNLLKRMLKTVKEWPLVSSSSQGTFTHCRVHSTSFNPKIKHPCHAISFISSWSCPMLLFFFVLSRIKIMLEGNGFDDILAIHDNVKAELSHKTVKALQHSSENGRNIGQVYIS